MTPDEQIERLMQEFYLSASYDPKTSRPADNVKAAIAFALDTANAESASGRFAALVDGRSSSRAMARRIAELEARNANLVTAEHRAVMANVRVGKWLSAALDDANVCEEMKADIREWFSAGHPPHALSVALAQGTEAQRATTVEQGVVHDGPVRDSECA